MPNDTHETFSSAKKVLSSAAALVEKTLTRRRVGPDKVKTSEEQGEREEIDENCLMGITNLGAEEGKDVNLKRLSNEIDDLSSVGADDVEYNIV